MPTDAPPTLAAAEYTECLKCDGTGFIETTCWKCDGEGCAACEYAGLIAEPCDACQTTGRLPWLVVTAPAGTGAGEGAT